ncbi:MAG: RpiB/LacA/LacB family sugar-phosphate isomerase, partial [bacterium]
MKKYKIAIGADHGGYELKEKLKLFLKKKSVSFKDFGTNDGKTSVDYPDFARRVAKAVASKKYNFGVLVCG